MVWVAECGGWAGGGLERVGEHVLTSGTRGALTALLVMPLGLWLGRGLMRRAEGRSRVALGATGAACVTLWVIGPFLG